MSDAITNILTILESEYPKWKAPVINFMADASAEGIDVPFQILVATVLSARTKDDVTRDAISRLFPIAPTPLAMTGLSLREIEKLIYPVGFYHTKAKRLPELAHVLLEDFDGQVPDTLDGLLSLPGVGRKTANLVISLAFGKPAICVDVHVHRISNRFGWIVTKTPEKTEMALREIVPLDWWARVNYLIVAFGQTICNPVSPHCSECPIRSLCPRIGVEKSR